MTAYKKIAISLPLSACEHAKRAVRTGRATSVSAYVAAAIDEKAKKDSLASLLAEMLQETGGPMTVAERRWADRKLGVTKAKPKRRR